MGEKCWAVGCVAVVWASRGTRELTVEVDTDAGSSDMVDLLDEMEVGAMRETAAGECAPGASSKSATVVGW